THTIYTLTIIIRSHATTPRRMLSSDLFYTPPPTTEIYTLSLHDALPISPTPWLNGKHTIFGIVTEGQDVADAISRAPAIGDRPRSEEHTSELQSRENLVCRLLLEKKKN